MLSISIVTFHQSRQILIATLKSLNQALLKLQKIDRNKVQVKIIDNGHQEALLKSIIASCQADHVEYELISGLNNIGYGCAHNLGILASKFKYHLVLNPDVILDENSLVEGISYLKNNPSTSAVTPSATDQNGQRQYISKQYPSLFNLLLRGFAPAKIKSCFKQRLQDYELQDVINSNTEKEVPIISGCFMLCNTQTLKDIGGFDKRFFLYFEDFALSMELNKHGPLCYLPKMKIQHFGGDSAKKGFKHIVMFARSGITFFNTYGWKLI